MAATRPADIAKAVTYTRRAGLRALQSLAPEEAIRWFTQTLELVAYDTTSEPTDRVDALIGLGDAQRQAGDPAFRQSLLDAASEALELHDGERLVAAALANHRGMVSSVGVIDPDRIAVLEHALVETGHIDSPTAARLLAALAAELSFSGDLPRVRALADEAEQMARRLEDDLTLLYVLNVTFLALCVPDAYERITAVTAELAELAERTDDPVADYWASINRVYGLAHALDGEGVDATLAHAWWRAGEIGQPYMRWHATYLRATHALRVGDHERAEELNTLALQVGTESGQPDAFVSYGAILAGIRRHQGRLDEILPIVEQVAGENPGLAALRGAQAMVLCECGRIDDARALVERARRDDFYDTSYNYVWLTSTTVWADVAAWLEHEEAAEVLLDRLVPHASLGVVSGSSCGGVVAAYLARLAVVVGRHEDAHRYFEQADQALRRPVQPMWLAANQYEWARLLGTSSGVERVRARGLLDEALVTAREFGCGGIEARVLTLASALS